MLATLATILRWLILLPVLSAVVLLAIANDHTVTVHLNPFDTTDPVLRADLALYQLAFIVFVLGALIGAVVAWRGQRKYRRQARRTSEEAAFWQARAERADQRRTELQPAGFLPRPERG
jgi:uncharacterized integral membrane protein